MTPIKGYSRLDGVRGESHPVRDVPFGWDFYDASQNLPSTIDG